jgi:O-acetyl-ADP-ribose deacetylase (regulator of RNase III)
MADEKGIQTISFPSISTGAYGYPVEEAAKIAIGEVAALLGRTDTSLQEVTFVLFDNLTFKTYSRALGLEGTVE